MLVAASVAATVTRWVALRGWVFAPGRDQSAPRATAPADPAALRRAEP